MPANKMPTIEPYRDDTGRQVLTHKQLIQMCGASNIIVDYWLRRTSRHHPPSRALRFSMIPTPYRCGNPEIRGYWLEDVERILSGAESDPQRLGSGRRRQDRHMRRRLGMPDAKEAVIMLKRYLEAGPRESKEVKAWAKTQRISGNFLYRARSSLKITNQRQRQIVGKTETATFCGNWWCLPGQSVPAHTTPFAEGTASFLTKILADKPMPAFEVIRRGKRAGISEHCLRRTREALGIKTVRTGERPYWRLPGKELCDELAMTPERRAVLDLLAGKGEMTLEQIAEALGKSLRAIRSLIYRLFLDDRVKSRPAEGKGRILLWEVVGEWVGDQPKPMPGAANETFRFGAIDPGSPSDAERNSASEKRKRGGGRKRDPATEEIYKFCYDGRVAGEKRGTILRKAQKKFGARAPKEARDVRLYADRYANWYGLPRPWKNGPH